jgi:hypothetical protein
VQERVDGPLNVAPDGWISAAVMAELGGPTPRLRLPANVVATLARIRWGLGFTAAPPGVLPYTVHPWVVSNDRLRALGWEPAHTNEEAYVAGHEPRTFDSLDAGSRQRISLGVAGGLVLTTLAGLMWLFRRSNR